MCMSVYAGAHKIQSGRSLALELWVIVNHQSCVLSIKLMSSTIPIRALNHLVIFQAPSMVGYIMIDQSFENRE